MKVKKARKLRDAIFVVGVVLMLLGYFYEPLIVVGAIVTCSCLIPHYLFNRCPHCGKNLGRSEGEFCPHCGKQID